MRIQQSTPTTPTFSDPQTNRTGVFHTDVPRVVLRLKSDEHTLGDAARIESHLPKGGDFSAWIAKRIDCLLEVKNKRTVQAIFTDLNMLSDTSSQEREAQLCKHNILKMIELKDRTALDNEIEDLIKQLSARLDKTDKKDKLLAQITDKLKMLKDKPVTDKKARALYKGALSIIRTLMLPLFKSSPTVQEKTETQYCLPILCPSHEQGAAPLEGPAWAQLHTPAPSSSLNYQERKDFSEQVTARIDRLRDEDTRQVVRSMIGHLDELIGIGGPDEVIRLCENNLLLEFEKEEQERILTAVSDPAQEQSRKPTMTGDQHSIPSRKMDAPCLELKRKVEFKKQEQESAQAQTGAASTTQTPALTRPVVAAQTLDQTHYPPPIPPEGMDFSAWINMRIDSLSNGWQGAARAMVEEIERYTEMGASAEEIRLCKHNLLLEMASWETNPVSAAPPAQAQTAAAQTLDQTHYPPPIPPEGMDFSAWINMRIDSLSNGWQDAARAMVEEIERFTEMGASAEEIRLCKHNLLLEMASWETIPVSAAPPAQAQTAAAPTTETTAPAEAPPPAEAPAQAPGSSSDGGMSAIFHLDQVVEEAERRNNDEIYELFDNLRELLNEMAEQNRLLIARVGNLEGMIEGQNQRIQELTRLNNERFNATDQTIQALNVGVNGLSDSIRVMNETKADLKDLEALKKHYEGHSHVLDYNAPCYGTRVRTEAASY